MGWGEDGYQIDITIAKNLPNASPMPPDGLPMLPNGLRMGVRSCSTFISLNAVSAIDLFDIKQSSIVQKLI
jgi:hypothetical protein